MKNVRAMSVKELENYIRELDQLPIMERLKIKNAALKELGKDLPPDFKAPRCEVQSPRCRCK